MSDICEATPIKSLFWDPNGLIKLLEMCFEFPSNLIGKLTMAFWTGQWWSVVVDPDLQIMEGGGESHPDPEIMGVPGLQTKILSELILV